MKLSEIQAQAEVDLKIDMSDLPKATTQIPLLVNKYYSIFLEEQALLKASENRLIRLYKEKYDYYSHASPPDVYIEKPFNRKVLKGDLDTYISSDEEYLDYDLKVTRQRHKTKYVEEIIKQLNQRSFNIKNIIEAQKFSNGGY